MEEKTKDIIYLSDNSSNGFDESFNKLQEVINKTTTYVSRSATGSTFMIKFYEWSDHTAKPLEFKDFQDFLKFATKCKIDLEMETRVAILAKAQSSTGVHIMCSKDGNKLFLEAGTYGLKYESERYERTKNNPAPSTVTNTTLPSTQRSPCGPVNPVYQGCCGHEWGNDYDCWE